MTTFKIQSSEYGVSASAYVETLAEAEAIAALFPKSVGVRAGRFTDARDITVTKGSVQFHVRTRSDGVNGGVNETGIRRLRTFFKTIDKQGFEATMPAVYSNNDGLTSVEAVRERFGA